MLAIFFNLRINCRVSNIKKKRKYKAKKGKRREFKSNFKKMQKKSKKLQKNVDIIERVCYITYALEKKALKSQKKV